MGIEKEERRLADQMALGFEKSLLERGFAGVMLVATRHSGTRISVDITPKWGFLKTTSDGNLALDVEAIKGRSNEEILQIYMDTIRICEELRVRCKMVLGLLDEVGAANEKFIKRFEDMFEE